jgi:hypothetical protein
VEIVMNSKIVKIGLISAFALGVPFLSFAGAQSDNPESGSSVQASPSDRGFQAEQRVTRQGKDAGSTFSDRPLVETNLIIEAPRRPGCEVYDHHTCPDWNDGAAFHK